MSNHQCHRGFSRVFGHTVTLGAIALLGCAPQHHDAILFGTNTQAGLKIGVDEKEVPTIILGYNRQEAAMVPLFAYGDGMFKTADRNVDCTTYLELARDRFENAKAATDAGTKKELFGDGVTLVKMAYAAASQRASKDAEAPKVSPGLERLYRLIEKPDIKDLPTCRLLTEAEIQRPSTAMRYLQEYKYVAECEGLKCKDAYSVLGTFSGSAKGGNNATTASGSIAQFFATGLAAQNLSRTPINSDLRDYLAEEILKKLNTNGSLNLDKLGDLIGVNGSLFKGRVTDKEIEGWKKDPSAIRSSLTQKFTPDELEKIRDTLQ
jgi:hypothetical protein